MFSPLEPQPNADSILTVKRYYAKHIDSCAYEKRVTWLEAVHHECPPHAIYEYRGVFPGFGEYRRMKPEVMEGIKHRVRSTKVKTVYDECDPVDGPLNAQAR